MMNKNVPDRKKRCGYFLKCDFIRCKTTKLKFAKMKCSQFSNDRFRKDSANFLKFKDFELEITETYEAGSHD